MTAGGGLEHLTVKVNGAPHPGVTRATVSYSSDNAVREAVIEADEPRGRPFVFRLSAPATVHCGADVVVTGFVVRLNRRVEKGKRQVTATIKSKATKAAKTAAQAPDYALKKRSVGAAAKALFDKVKVPVHDDAGGKAYDWKWRPGETAFDVVERQARSAGLLMMGHGDGGVVVAKGIRGQHAGVLAMPGEITEGSSDLSDEGEYAETIALGQKGSGDKKSDLRPSATAKNAKVDDGTVQIVLNETEFDAQDLTVRASARRNRRRGANVSCTLPVPRWRDDAGRLWEPAFTIPVSAYEDLEIDQVMAIKSVVLRYAKAKDGGEAMTAELNLVDPPALNGKGGKSKSSSEYGSDTSPAKYAEE